MKNKTSFSEILKLDINSMGTHAYRSSIASSMALCASVVRKAYGHLPNIIIATVSIRKITGAIPIVVCVNSEEGQYRDSWKFENEEFPIADDEMGMYCYAFKVLSNLLENNGLSIHETNTIWLKIMAAKD